MRALIISGLAGLAGMAGVVGVTQAGPLGLASDGSGDAAAPAPAGGSGLTVQLERRLDGLARAQGELDRTLTQSPAAIAPPPRSLPVGAISSHDDDRFDDDDDAFEDDDGRHGRGRGRGGDDHEDDD